MASNVRVVIRQSEMRKLGRLPQVRDDLERRARTVMGRARRAAPVSDKGNHGRAPGYLKANIHIRRGADTHGWWVDVVSDARSPEGFPYGKVVSIRRRLLRTALRPTRRSKS